MTHNTATTHTPCTNLATRGDGGVVDVLKGKDLGAAGVNVAQDPANIRRTRILYGNEVRSTVVRVGEELVVVVVAVEENDGFAKVQRLSNKVLPKVLKARRDYHRSINAAVALVRETGSAKDVGLNGYHNTGQSLLRGLGESLRDEVVHDGVTILVFRRGMLAVGIHDIEVLVAVLGHAIVESIVAANDVAVDVHDISVLPHLDLRVVLVRNLGLEGARSKDGVARMVVIAVTEVVEALERIVVPVAETVAIRPAVVTQRQDTRVVERVDEVLEALVVELSTRTTTALDVTRVDGKDHIVGVDCVAKILENGAVFVIRVKDVNRIAIVGQITPKSDLVRRSRDILLSKGVLLSRGRTVLECAETSRDRYVV
jgi:hypothetical protein